MKKYDILLADADDTLLDFALCEKTAVTLLFKEFGVCPDDGLLSAYSEHNDQLWKRLERGEITIKQLVALRFAEFFSDHNIKGDGAYAAIRYKQILSRCAYKTEGADELLRRCRGKVRVYIISNGITDVQTSRFRLAGITELVDGLFLSEDLGAKKPDPVFFEKAVSSIGCFCKEKTLVYGDSLTADIAGGNAFGIDTCWYNPHNTVNVTGILPDYEIRDHSELYPLLGI